MEFVGKLFGIAKLLMVGYFSFLVLEIAVNIFGHMALCRAIFFIRWLNKILIMIGKDILRNISWNIDRT